MTSTTADDMGPSIMDMSDDDLDAYADHVAATAPRTGVGRDRFGRFTRRANIESVTTWVNTVDGMSHAEWCGDLRGTRHRAGVAVASVGDRDGWACTACTHVDVRSPWIMDRDNAPTTGTQTCPTCDTERGVKSFPTIIMAGFRMRAVSCRKCESAARSNGIPFDNYAATYDRYVADTDRITIPRRFAPRPAPLHGPVIPYGVAA